MIYIRPKETLKVFYPDGSLLSEKGAYVSLDLYWRRRLAEGCVIEVKNEKEEPKKKEK